MSEISFYKGKNNRYVSFDFFQQTNGSNIIMRLSFLNITDKELEKFCKKGKYLYYYIEEKGNYSTRYNILKDRYVLKFKFNIVDRERIKEALNNFIEMDIIDHIDLELLNADLFIDEWLINGKFLSLDYLELSLGKLAFKCMDSLSSIHNVITPLYAEYMITYKPDIFWYYFKTKNLFYRPFGFSKKSIFMGNVIDITRYFLLVVQEKRIKTLDDFSNYIATLLRFDLSSDLLKIKYNFIENNVIRPTVVVDNTNIVMTTQLVDRLLKTDNLIYINKQALEEIQKECAKIVIIKKPEKINLILHLDTEIRVFAYSIDIIDKDFKTITLIKYKEF